MVRDPLRFNDQAVLFELVKPAVMEFWSLQRGSWTQKRLSKEGDIVSKRAEVARQNGKHGGRRILSRLPTARKEHLDFLDVRLGRSSRRNPYVRGVPGRDIRDLLLRLVLKLSNL